MAYGRLDVFFPDGLMRSFPLTEANISIGRSIGNTIVLETDTISRYHLSLTRTDQGVFLTDLESQNGTFVDGVRIPHNQPLALRGGEEILIGELILIFHDVDDSPTRPIVVPEETQLAARVDQTYRIELEQPDIAVPPGAHTSARLKIINLIETPQRFAITAAGLPREWLRIMPSQVEVGPEASTEIAISIKPLRRPDSRPGDYRLEVSVIPLDVDAEEAGQRRLTVQTSIRILPFGGFGLALEPRRLRPGDRFRLHMHNQGSAELPIRLGARSIPDPDGRDRRADDVIVTFAPSQVIFAPGQRLTVTGTARPARTPLLGEPRLLAFDVIARSGDAAAYTIAQRAYLLVKPLLPRQSIYVLLGLGIALMALTAIVLAGLLDQASNPVIARFNVRAAIIEQGTPIEVEWETHNAQSLALFIDDLLVADDIDPASGYAQISSSAVS
ncbi:MAG: FHA domain-containing protein, partial [Anaerolinea sp.]|nr:FHA domain-containing protein [Anaerolinea sp.]